jgi:hypothetical protein
MQNMALRLRNGDRFMSNKIRMYNCMFGDCFRITHHDALQDDLRHLYVDFGIHSHGTNKQARINRYDEIIADIPRQHVDFLLSHYHTDHYEGALRIAEAHGPLFRNVYIPDVWNRDTNIEVLKLLLLNDLRKSSVLAHGQSLIAFLISICSIDGRIYFVRRGSVIQEHYIALWPSVDAISQEAGELYQKLPQQETQFSDAITNIAEQLRQIMQQISQTDTRLQREHLLPRLTELEDQLRELAQRITVNKSTQIKLSAFQHRINIIFQNIDPKERNILFTGDADGDENGYGKRMWKFLQDNSDSSVTLHDHYDVIKVPHHGTRPHYHDFTALCRHDTVFMIPNLPVFHWPIDLRYMVDAHNHHCQICGSPDIPCGYIDI